MPEFNNIKQELNDGEKFALVCGMLAGLRLQDKTQPPSQVTVTLEPIGVNGLGCIGLMAEDIKYNGVRTLKIPVVTHDVDREYAGFSLSFSYPNDRLRINSIEDGDFGNIEYTSFGNGKAYTRCMLPIGENVNKPHIVCWINCTVLQEPTDGNPIEIVFNNSTGYDPNYCTLLTWVLNDVDNNYYSYFITPTVNKGCRIYSEESADKSNETNLGESQQISAKASPSMISMGISYIIPGSQGVVPIYTNCNTEDNLPYNQFILKARISSGWLSVVSLADIVGTGEWSITYERSTDENGDLILDIQGIRAEPKVDNSTPGYLRFVASSSASQIECLIENTYSELVGPTGSLGVTKGDGYLYYPENVAPNDGRGNGLLLKGGTGGGMRGSGSIWSSVEQIIWVSLGNGNKYPIYLKPGYNQVHIWLPNIVPEDKWEETTPTIEAPGYILIPGGFTWDIIMSPDAPLELASQRLLDRFEIKDIYDIMIESAPIPVNLDEIMDTFEIIDEMKLDILNIVSSNENFINNIELQDFIDVYVKSAPVSRDELFNDEVDFKDFINILIEEPPVSSSDNVTDKFIIEDITYFSTLNVDIDESLQNEESEITDFIDVFMPRMLPVTGKVNNETYGSIQGLKVYEEKTYATLTAVPNSGYTVNGWYIDDTLVSNEKTITFLVDRAIEVFLEFIETLLSEFDVAINKPGSQLVFENISPIPWIVNTDEYGGVKSGAISDNGSTEISTVIAISGAFSYDYKVSSENNYDKLQVYKNDNLLNTYSGTNEASNVLIGVAVGDIIKFSYTKDGSGASGSDACWIKNVYMIDNSKFNESVNKEGSSLEFTNDSPVPWLINNGDFGGVRSGLIRDSESTSISTTIEKDGTLYFDYSVSSESNWDKLYVYKNDNVVYTYSGETSENEVSIEVITGDVIKFTYIKDGSGSSGDDCAYIRNIYLA